MSKVQIKTSKFLSYVLRHRPDSIGLNLDSQGWASVDELICYASKDGKRLTHELIAEVVANNDKQRFVLSPDGQRIRANQGHSISIDLGLQPITPPATLYHGTATQFLKSIERDGLKPRNRHHVHLSSDIATARAVGQRHGMPAILVIDAQRMGEDGCVFYCSDNGVWLTDSVPPRYIQRLKNK